MSTVPTSLRILIGPKYPQTLTVLRLGIAVGLNHHHSSFDLTGLITAERTVVICAVAVTTLVTAAEFTCFAAKTTII